MNDSILTSIKKLLGIDAQYTSFDQDIIIHINSVIAILKQIGVGNQNFSITGTTEKWSDYLGSETGLEEIKTYIYLKVRKIFDPPTSSAVASSFDELIKELEWRIFVATDPKEDTTCQSCIITES